MLFINGVQIFPVLPSKLKIEKKRREQIWIDEKFGQARIIAEPYFKRKDSLFEEMRRVYGIIEPKEGRDKAIDSILKIAKTDTLIVEIKEPTFVGEDDCSFLIIYFMPGYENTTGLLLQLNGGDPSSGYKPRLTPTKQEMNAIKKRQAMSIKKQAEKDLRNQYVITYTSSGNSGFDREYSLWRILEILKSDTIELERKIEKLDRFMATEKDCKELIYNFAPSEWPIKKEDK
jgi:hypothetical protein